jgi:hypothetical protein
MKRTHHVLLLAACWLAMGFGCGREPQPCTEEVGLPILLEEELGLLLRTRCSVLNEEKPKNFEGTALPVTEYIINSQAELERWVGCSDAKIPSSIDFSRYTLIVGQKLTGGRGFTEQSLHWRCNVIHYQLRYNSFGGFGAISLVSYFALIPKVSFKPTIEYEIDR